MSRGKRADAEAKLNVKKIIGLIVAIVVVILFIASMFNGIKKGDSGTKTRELIVPTSYYSAYQDGKWGVIDNKGEVIIPLTYDEIVAVPDNSKDIFIATYNIDYTNKTFSTKVLDKTNRELLTDYIKVKTIQNERNGKIWYEKNVLTFEQDGKIGLIDFSGKQLTDELYDNVYAMPGIEGIIVLVKDGKCGLLNSSTGLIVFDVKYNEIKSLDPTSYTYGFIVKDESDNYGLFDANSKQVLGFDYSEILQIANNDYFAVRDANEANDPKPLKVIGTSQETLLTSEVNDVPKIDNIVSINGKNIIYVSDNKYGLINIDGEVLIEAKDYDELKYAGLEVLIAKKESGRYGLIDLSGNEKMAFAYSSISYLKDAGLLLADKEDFKTDIIDSTYKVVLADAIISQINQEEGYLRIYKENNYKYFNYKLEEKQAKDLMPTNTLYLYKNDGKYGYRNQDNKVVVDCQYDDAKEQNVNGYCAVKKDGLWGVLKSDGKVLLEPKLNLDNNLEIDFIGDWHLAEDSSILTYVK